MPHLVFSKEANEATCPASMTALKSSLKLMDDGGAQRLLDLYIFYS